MPTKPKRTVVPAPPQPPSENLSDFAAPMELPLTSIVIAEPPSWPKIKAATKASAAIQPLKRKRSYPSITESDESLASVRTSPPTTSSSTAPSLNKRRQIIKQTQIQIKSIVFSIKKVAAQSQDVETGYTHDNTVGQSSLVQTFPTHYYISPKYEGPETSMTVGEAERLYKSDSD